MFTRKRSSNRCTLVERKPCPNKRRLQFLLVSVCLLLTFPVFTDPYAYQDRGDRREGIRLRPVSGDDIELISVRAAPVGGAADLTPQEMRLVFYLPEDANVNITVRELDYRYYYWLDQVRPQRSWQSGQTNVFH